MWRQWRLCAITTATRQITRPDATRPWQTAWVTDFAHENLSGARFEDVDLTGADFHDVDFTGARFGWVDLTGVTIRVADLVDIDISGEVKNFRINGVDVAPLVEAELDRRYPGRAKMRPSDAAGYREAWEMLAALWKQTVARARDLDPELLHRRVDGEWSFIETLRHLVFATDAWVNRAILGQPFPWDPLDLPFDELPDEPSIPRDRDARPSLDEVLALRADRMATVRSVLADLTDEQLAGMTRPATEPGYPEPTNAGLTQEELAESAAESFPVRYCLRVILNEEWQHRLFAERDLDALERQPG